MRVAIGSDHRGVNVKSKLLNLLRQLGHEVVDEGTNSEDCIDYPDIAGAVGRKVSSGVVDRGILVCGTGIGMAIVANKFPGVRAAACHDEISAEICRRHNDVNVLCLSGDMLGERPIDNLVMIWIQTEFEGGRHARRLQKIAEIERNGSGSGASPRDLQGDSDFIAALRKIFAASAVRCPKTLAAARRLGRVEVERAHRDARHTGR